ncbi:MAG: fructose-bisphosphatase class II [Leptospirales bacterium]|nr:fructose-bisphosphatase class II [Leptospirales bacterium]
MAAAGALNDLQKLGLELAGVTEAAARAVMPLSGKGDKHSADRIAVECMRHRLNELDRNFHIVLGEGEKDEAPMLFAGERLGRRAQAGASDQIDLIVDPLECTTNFARGLPDSMSVVLASSAGSIQATPGTYMQQLLVPPAAAALLDGALDLDAPPQLVLQQVADALGLKPTDLCVAVQDRPRHEPLIAALRAAGGGVSLIESGSISAAVEILRGSGRLHMLYGVFGAPEGVVIAFLARETGAGFLGRMAPHNESAAAECRALGLEGRQLHERDLVRADGVIAMSGIHGSAVLPGVAIHRREGGLSHDVHTLVWTPGQVLRLLHRDGRSVDQASI